MALAAAGLLGGCQSNPPTAESANVATADLAHCYGVNICGGHNDCGTAKRYRWQGA